MVTAARRGLSIHPIMRFVSSALRVSSGVSRFLFHLRLTPFLQGVEKRRIVFAGFLPYFAHNLNKHGMSIVRRATFDGIILLGKPDSTERRRGRSAKFGQNVIRFLGFRFGVCVPALTVASWRPSKASFASIASFPACSTAASARQPGSARSAIAIYFAPASVFGRSVAKRLLAVSVFDTGFANPSPPWASPGRLELTDT